MMTVPSMANGRCDALVDALQAEFGAIMAARILEGEAMDFLWDARVRERYLGEHICTVIEIDDDARDMARIAILSTLAGRWYAALCVVDGEAGRLSCSGSGISSSMTRHVTRSIGSVERRIVMGGGGSSVAFHLSSTRAPS